MIASLDADNGESAILFQELVYEVMQLRGWALESIGEVRVCVCVCFTRCTHWGELVFFRSLHAPPSVYFPVAVPCPLSHISASLPRDNNLSQIVENMFDSPVAEPETSGHVDALGAAAVHLHAMGASRTDPRESPVLTSNSENGDNELSEYERQRERNVATNNKQLALLGIIPLTQSPTAQARPRKMKEKAVHHPHSMIMRPQKSTATAASTKLDSTAKSGMFIDTFNSADLDHYITQLDVADRKRPMKRQKKRTAPKPPCPVCLHRSVQTLGGTGIGVRYKYECNECNTRWTQERHTRLDIQSGETVPTIIIQTTS